ncbi:MAG TPA: GTPase ObgE, partial [Candidatus Paceibacterota bacterium]|nr:GTPase ObgE [Candidatus Paceibacterota bacterium]
MAFVDQVTIHASSGRGGNGVIRWAHTKTNAHGGPCGGNGGRGGDVILVGERNLSILMRYRNEKKFPAEPGEAGKGDMKNGANGADSILPVPVGTVARLIDTGEEYEITKEGERITLFHGGRGGLGNARFKSSTNQNPFEQTNGKEGK